jgi:hypothetical protein
LAATFSSRGVLLDRLGIGGKIQSNKTNGKRYLLLSQPRRGVLSDVLEGTLDQLPGFPTLSVESRHEAHCIGGWSTKRPFAVNEATAHKTYGTETMDDQHTSVERTVLEILEVEDNSLATK